jgi:enterochelin esterase-like enzyme
MRVRAPVLLAFAGLAIAVVVAVAGARETRQVSATFRSVALGGPVHATVVLPPDYDTSGERYPVVYFLHGLPASPSAYEDVGWLESAVADLGGQAILVAPQGARRGDTDPEYLNWGPGRNWESYVAAELPNYVDAHFRTIPAREGRALVGLSAGGYGAVLLGFHHLGRFAVIESWSGYFHATDPTGTRALARGPRTNVHRLIGALSADERQRPTFFAFYVGRGDDRFRDENEQLDRELDAAGVPHLFQLYPGAHERAVWRAHATAWLGLALRHLAAPA